MNKSNEVIDNQQHAYILIVTGATKFPFGSICQLSDNNEYHNVDNYDVVKQRKDELSSMYPDYQYTINKII